MMPVEQCPLELAGLVEMVPRRFGDERGFFMESWRDEWIDELDPGLRFVQDNHSLSRDKGTVRGLHLQLSPAQQAKLVRVLKGSIFDVAVDLRRGSPTFGRWAGLTLSAERGNMLFVPAGFAHGFMTLEPDCEVLYKASAYYDPGLERAIRFDDPQIGIEWPEIGSSLSLSSRDRDAPPLAEVEHEL